MDILAPTDKVEWDMSDMPEDCHAALTLIDTKHCMWSFYYDNVRVDTSHSFSLLRDSVYLDKELKEALAKGIAALHRYAENIERLDLAEFL